MRALFLCCALALPFTLSAQAPRMLKIDIVKKSDFGGHEKGDKKMKHSNEPSEVKVRMPISLIKGVLGSIEQSEIKVNGKDKKGIKLDELVKLLESAKAGDMLLEVTTDKGDLVKITVE